jgi:hypothetical protein
MADTLFKDSINRTTVAEQPAAGLAVHSTFDATGFETKATRDLHAVELKDRLKQVASALRAHLPDDWDETTRSDRLQRKPLQTN